jgi:5,10-methylenetetrahydromethanopterin reductase
MKFSIAYLPDHDLKETLEIAKKADELGYYGLWPVDEIYHKDPWITMAMCAMETEKLVYGPAVTHVYLRDPTLIAQSLGTLDELSNGRVACAISIGNIIMLEQYHIQWKNTKPIARLKEAVSIIRKLLNGEPLTHEGEFYRYSGLFSASKKIGKIPIYIGGMGGPRSFRLAGEIGDGGMFALGYSYDYYKEVVEEMEKGAKKSGRDFEEIDVAGWINYCVSKDSDAAKEAARLMVGFYIPAMPERQLRAHGVNPEDVKEINEAFFQGDVKKVVDLTTMDLVERLSVSGSPDEIVDKIEKDFIKAGVKHLVCCFIDPSLVKFFTGQDIKGVPSYTEMLELTKEEIMPHFE